MRTLASVRRIVNDDKRLAAASTLVREARAKADAARSRRDHAALVLIEPFARAVAEPNALRADASDAYYGCFAVDGRRYGTRKEAERAAATTGSKIEEVPPTIDVAEYQARLARAREVRQDNYVKFGVTVEPAEVYHLIGVSRALLVRMMKRLPEHLPPLHGDHTEVGKQATKEAEKWDRVADEALAYRDELAMSMLGQGDDGVQRRRNAEVAQLTGLTTARVAQMRTGTR
jgi:hypothetical protein